MGGRYDTFKYGDGTKYGASVGVTDLLWGVEVDWDNDGDFTGENESVRTIGMTVDRGRQDFLQLDGDNQATGFQRLRPGTCTVTFDNTDGRYDPNNTSSPLYPGVDLGRDVKITVRNGSTDTKKGVFYGVIDDIKVYDDNVDNRVVIRATDSLRYLSDQGVRVDTTTDTTIDALIREILDTIVYPDGIDLSASEEVVPYWWVDKRAYSAIYDLVDSEGGYFFIDADGDATFHSQWESRPVAVNLAQSQLLRDMRLDLPWENVRDIIRVYASPLAEGSTNTELWSLPDVPVVDAGETQEFWARYTYENNNVPALDVYFDSTDLTANAAADGSGANLTSSMIVSLRNFGDTGKLTVRNNGTVPAYITSLKVRGVPVYELSRVYRETGEGSRLFELDHPWIQSSGRALEMSEWLNLFLSRTQQVPTVAIEARPDIQFEADLFDKVNLDMPARNIDQNYIVGGIRHRWLNPTGYNVRTEIDLEPSRDPDDYLTQIGVEFAAGSGDGLRYGIVPIINQTSDYLLRRTIAFWMNVSSTDGFGSPTENRNMIVWGNIADPLYVVAYKEPQCAIRVFRKGVPTGSYIYDTSSDTITEDTWTHIAITHETSPTTDCEPIIYIDGVSSPISSTGDGLGAPSGEVNANFVIGNNRPLTNAVDGTIKGVRIYNRLLPSTDVADLYAGVDITDGLLFHGPAVFTGELADYIDKNINGLPVYDAARGKQGSVTGVPTGREST